MPEHDLLLLTWRYAALIGIIGPEGAEMTQAQVDADRARWPDLVEKLQGSPVFDVKKGAAFMAELSGQPVHECRRVHGSIPSARAL